MANKPRWELKEDKILLRNIVDNYDNLSIAFKKTSIELDRSIPACRQRWYDHLRTNKMCFASISEKKAMKNRKTLPKNYNEKFLEMSKKKSKLKELIGKIRKLFV